MAARSKAATQGVPVAELTSRAGAVAPEPRQATVHEAKTHLSRLLQAVESGESVVITRRGTPVATLEPIAKPIRNRVFGSMKGQIAIDDRFFEPLPDDELELWGET